MTKDEMIREIQKFIDQFDGTAIGYRIKNMLDNAADNEDCIEEIYEEIENY
ncbi:MAG: hypothetical protein J5992_07650 [Oscillospiraceae bacterium]|nr:hypothetical protein [Oscillospiraceae bacterium]